MTPEQKQHAVALVKAWDKTAYGMHADSMAALLQELINAPEPAPADVARDAARYRWLRTHGLRRAWVSLGTDFEGDNFASFRCEFNLPEPPNLPYEDDEGLQWADKDFDAAIDAAIERAAEIGKAMP